MNMHIVGFIDKYREYKIYSDYESDNPKVLLKSNSKMFIVQCHRPYNHSETTRNFSARGFSIRLDYHDYLLFVKHCGEEPEVVSSFRLPWTPSKLTIYPNYNPVTVRMTCDTKFTTNRGNLVNVHRITPIYLFSCSMFNEDPDKWRLNEEAAIYLGYEKMKFYIIQEACYIAANSSFYRIRTSRIKIRDGPVYNFLVNNPQPFVSEQIIGDGYLRKPITSMKASMYIKVDKGDKTKAEAIRNIKRTINKVFKKNQLILYINNTINRCSGEISTKRIDNELISIELQLHAEANMLISSRKYELFLFLPHVYVMHLLMIINSSKKLLPLNELTLFKLGLYVNPLKENEHTTHVFEKEIDYFLPINKISPIFIWYDFVDNKFKKGFWISLYDKSIEGIKDWAKTKHTIINICFIGEIDKSYAILKNSNEEKLSDIIKHMQNILGGNKIDFRYIEEKIGKEIYYSYYTIFEIKDNNLTKIE